MNNPDEFQSRVRFNRPTLSEQRRLGFILNDEDKTRFCSTFEGSNGAMVEIDRILVYLQKQMAKEASLQRIGQSLMTPNA